MHCLLFQAFSLDIPHILSELGLPDHLEGVISCLSGLGNIVPECIGQHFHLGPGCVSVEEVGIATCWMDRGTAQEKRSFAGNPI